MENEYIELLLKRCLKVNKNTPLFISYPKIINNFVNKLVRYAKKIGLTDIYLDEIDSYDIHNKLKKMSLKKMEESPLFNCKKWDEYAKKDAAFLMLESEIPHLMDDVLASKIAKSAYLKSTSKPIYKEKQLKSELAWCIACVPNIKWAQDIFKEEKLPLKKFWQVIFDICMIDGHAIENWNNFLKNQKNIQDKLNALKITKLYYKNSLGTDLEITLSEEALWASASSGKWIVNLPSYEIFTSPNYKETKGVVYATKPLMYSGKLISDFYIKFDKGKAISYDAKEGKDVLKDIINGDKLSSFLGEVALVNYDSPISNTNLLFKSTLIDENASCHLALGSGFLECISNGNKLSDKELDAIGLNSSKNHVDFMIGSKDLTIEADTKDGHITIMKNGNLTI